MAFTVNGLEITVPDYLNPFRDPIAWNTIVVAGFEVGPRAGDILANVGASELKYEWDRKKGRGVRGETSTLVQVPAVDVEVEFEIWGTTGVELWHRLLYLLRHQVGPGLTKVLAIEHPRLLQVGVTNVCIDSIAPLHIGQGGRHAAGFKCHEWFPPPPVSIASTPSGVSSNDPTAAAGAGLDPATTAAKSEFDAALGDAKAMGNPFAVEGE